MATASCGRRGSGRGAVLEEMGGNVEVDVVAVADEIGSDVVVVAASKEETDIDVRVIVDAVEETARGMRESKS